MNLKLDTELELHNWKKVGPLHVTSHLRSIIAVSHHALHSGYESLHDG